MVGRAGLEPATGRLQEARSTAARAWPATMPRVRCY